ncbi:hypothetical protein [Dyadobacter sp. CY347]|uniref:hypothetical protein n=1 Tax=Dyadobacter sp. CY347 TaxID=2909336 RepID=UPI001F253523|nr:hypothetical protein [Dyadobacter sp. CY347]MCF2489170.1 hypothetical protein [Dyadobacter sp. CY347]
MRVNRKWSKLIGFMLLLATLAAGLSWYLSPKKGQNLQKAILPHPGPDDNKHFNITGRVIKYGSNHEGDIDKLLLSSNEGEIWLHFPPHMARQVTSVATINAQVKALANESRPRPGEHRNDSYTITSLTNNAFQTKVDLHDIPAPIPKKGIEIKMKGKPSVNQNENAFMLAGKMVTLPPHMARALFPLINQAKTITVKGFVRDSTDGFLSESGMPIVRPTLVEIDSVTYKIR